MPPCDMGKTSARHGRRSSSTVSGAEYEQLGGLCLHLIGSYMLPDSLSRFRNIDLFHRRKLKSTVVDALVASTSARATVALGKIAEKGNAGAIAAVSARLEDERGYVRQAAVGTLEKIAEKADAIVMVSASLELADKLADTRPSRYNFPRYRLGWKHLRKSQFFLEILHTHVYRNDDDDDDDDDETTTTRDRR